MTLTIASLSVMGLTFVATLVIRHLDRKVNAKTAQAQAAFAAWVKS